RGRCGKQVADTIVVEMEHFSTVACRPGCMTRRRDLTCTEKARSRAGRGPAYHGRHEYLGEQWSWAGRGPVLAGREGPRGWSAPQWRRNVGRRRMERERRLGAELRLPERELPVRRLPERRLPAVWRPARGLPAHRPPALPHPA